MAIGWRPRRPVYPKNTLHFWNQNTLDSEIARLSCNTGRGQTVTLSAIPWTGPGNPRDTIQPAAWSFAFSGECWLASSPALIFYQAMSALGQSRRSDRPSVTSGLPRSTDILGAGRHVSEVPTTDSCTGEQPGRHSDAEGHLPFLDGLCSQA